MEILPPYSFAAVPAKGNIEHGVARPEALLLLQQQHRRQLIGAIFPGLECFPTYC